MPMKSNQILSKVPRGRKIAAAYVKVTALRGVRRNGRIIFLAKTKSSANASGTPKPGPLVTYISEIQVLNDKLHLQVSCSCPDFMYTWEYALAAKGAAIIQYSNGDAPDERNPKYVPGCCKHLFTMLTKLVELGKL